MKIKSTTMQIQDLISAGTPGEVYLVLHVVYVRTVPENDQTVGLMTLGADRDVD